MIGSKSLWLTAFVACVVVVPRPAAAQSGGESPVYQVRDTIGVAANNAGLQNALDLSWSWRLTSSGHPLRRDSHLALGVSQTVTPSFGREGPWVEFSPLSIVALRAGVEPTVYFGTFESLMSFARYDNRFDNETRKTLANPFGPGTAARVYISPTVKVRVGPVAALASSDFEWWRSSASGPLFYEPSRDTLIRTDGGGLFNSSALMLYQHTVQGGTLSAGVLHRMTYVYDAPDNRIQKVGPIVMREFAGRRLGLNQPTLLANLSYYVNDPSKQHQLDATLAISFSLKR